tara:strand:- start:322 stop:663 length:342 start_codon:yes stop_codon:yes gene_type:complete
MLSKYTIELTTDASHEDVLTAICLLGSSNDLRITRKPLANGKPRTVTPDPRILYFDPTVERPSKVIDVVGSLKSMGLTVDNLFNRPYKSGSAEHTVKQAVTNNRRYHGQDVAQ